MGWPEDLAHYCIQDGVIPAEVSHTSTKANGPTNTIGSHPALLHAIQSGLIDKTGRLLKPRAAIVRFCTEHHYLCRDSFFRQSECHAGAQ